MSNDPKIQGIAENALQGQCQAILGAAMVAAESDSEAQIASCGVDLVEGSAIPARVPVAAASSPSQTMTC